MRYISILGAKAFVKALKKCYLPVFMQQKRLILRHFVEILTFMSASEIRESQIIKDLSFCINQPPAILEIENGFLNKLTLCAILGQDRNKHRTTELLSLKKNYINGKND